MADDPIEIKRITKQLYTIAGFNAQNPEDQDEPTELAKGEHGLFIYGQFFETPYKLIGVDGGQPWIIYWLTNALNTLAYE
jgi:hypothetical protein